MRFIAAFFELANVLWSLFCLVCMVVGLYISLQQTPDPSGGDAAFILMAILFWLVVWVAVAGPLFVISLAFRPRK